MSPHAWHPCPVVVRPPPLVPVEVSGEPEPPPTHTHGESLRPCSQALHRPWRNKWRHFLWGRRQRAVRQRPDKTCRPHSSRARLPLHRPARQPALALGEKSDQEEAALKAPTELPLQLELLP